MDAAPEHADPQNAKQYAALRSDLAAALSAFDRAQDWADLIHDLQRVNRVFAKHARTAYLPEKQLLAKRLSQCLTSSLPSGVHLKALETYRLVFTRIGPQRLALDLPYYAGGLFPLLSYSATSLKPALLSLYESQLLPLGPALVPLLDGFVLAILPGLEDETSEFYERSVALLDSVAASVQNPDAFCRALWGALLLSPPVRLPAASYIRTRLTSDKKLAWTRHLLDDMPLVSHAIAAALNDKNALVQRSVLDLLLGELSLDLPFFAKPGEECHAAAVALVSGVFGALLRRDLSLTKRVHSWFLGGKEGDRGVRFCSKYSKKWLLGAMDAEIEAAKVASAKESATASVATRPCKIAVGLVDRTELSVCIAAPLSLKVLRFEESMRDHVVLAVSRGVFHAVSEVLETLGSAVICDELKRFVDASTADGSKDGGDQDLEEAAEIRKYKLLSSAVSRVVAADSDVRVSQLPTLLNVAVDALNRLSGKPSVLQEAVSFCETAVRAMNIGTCPPSAVEVMRPMMREVGAAFTSFFVAWIATSVQSSPSEMRRAYTDIAVSDEVSAEMETDIMPRESQECEKVAKKSCAFLTSLVKSGVCGAESSLGGLQAAAKCASAGDIHISLAGARAYAEIAAHVAKDELKHSMEEQTFGVIRKAWRVLHPSLSSASASSAQVWLLLQRQFPDVVNVVIADGVLSAFGPRRLRNLERFACLWRLSVEHRLFPAPADPGLFLMLDALDDRDWGPKMVARSWLSDALSTDASAVLDGPLRLLLTPKACSRGDKHVFTGIYDAPRALYAFQVLRSIVESALLGTRGVTGDASSDVDDDEGSESMTPIQSTENAGVRSSTRSLSAGARSLSSTSPSARTLAAVSGLLGAPAGRPSLGSTASEGDSEGPIKLLSLLPCLDYVTVLTITSLSYLRGTKPPICEALEKHRSTIEPNGIHSQANGNGSADLGGDVVAQADEDDMEWISAGLGFKPFEELHDQVALAAAEFLAKLLTSVPAVTSTSDLLAERSADAILHLLAQSIRDRDAVLQLHFLEALEALIISERRGFPGGTMSKSALSAQVQNVAESSKATTQSLSVVSTNRSLRYRGGGYVEKSALFFPWILAGLVQACKYSRDGRDVGSQEVLSLRRRWVQFVSTIFKNVSFSFPNLSEGLVLTLCLLLDERVSGSGLRGSTQLAHVASETEFSRIDDRLLLLRGLASVSGTICFVFEYAKRMGLFEDGMLRSRSGGFVGVGEGLSRRRNSSSSNDLRSLSGRPQLVGAGPQVSDGSVSNRSDSRGRADGHSEVAGRPGVLPPAHRQQTTVTEKSSVHGPGSLPASATMSMMNAINNPLRMLNDFVKDVFTGSGSENALSQHDPRRNAARMLFLHMGSIVGAVFQTWAPQMTQPGSETGRGPYSEKNKRNALRLSRELPREKRQSLRAGALSVIEPLFALRPLDVVAAVVGVLIDTSGMSLIGGDEKWVVAVDMLGSIDGASPDVVVGCVCDILTMAMKWDKSIALAADGRLQLEKKEKARQAIRQLLERGAVHGMSMLDAIATASAHGVSGAPLPGSDYGESETSGLLGSGSANASGPRPGASKLFHAGDFFAALNPGDVEVTCLRFLERYILSCEVKDGLIGAWPALHSVSKEVQVSHSRKTSLIFTCRALGAFAKQFQNPLPDRRVRKELMGVSAAVVAVCSTIASGSHDLSSEVPLHGDGVDLRSTFSMQALRALADSMPALLDACFGDEKAQLNNTLGVSFGAAVATLKRVASKTGASRAVALDAAGRLGGTPRASATPIIDVDSCVAAADLILHVSKREWGVKLVRRELVGLLDDQNFFYGKQGGVLKVLAAVVREVMVSGGSATLLSAIGTSTPTSATGIPGLFTGRDAETVLRSRAVRRVAFCVFVAEPDSYLPQLPNVLERLRDSLRLGDPGLVVECLLCLRVLLLRTGPASIAAFRATTLSETFRVASDPSRNLAETLSTLQFLDLITLVSPPDFGFVRCFFFTSDRGRTQKVSDVPQGLYEPLVPKLIALRDEKSSGSPANSAPYSDCLRVAKGQTVFSGALFSELNVDFIGRYAECLATRNQLPAMANASPDFDLIRRELEQEFVQ